MKAVCIGDRVWAYFRTWGPRRDQLNLEWLTGIVESRGAGMFLVNHEGMGGQGYRQWIAETEVVSEEEYAKRTLAL